MAARILSAFVFCAVLASAQTFPPHNNGWDGPGLGSAPLTYSVNPAQPPYFSSAETEHALVVAAYLWMPYVDITLTGRTSNRTALRNLDIEWSYLPQASGYAAGAGPAYDMTPLEQFNGSNSGWEPSAGDIFLNSAHPFAPYWTWSDVQSFVNHEMGHAMIGLTDLEQCTYSIMCHFGGNNEPTAYDASWARAIYATRTTAPPDLPACSGCPVISAFTVNGGSSATLNSPLFAAIFESSITGASVVTITHAGRMAPNLLSGGTYYYYQPTVGTIYYTLIATNGYGSATRTVSVTVLPPPCSGRDCTGGGSTTLAINTPSSVLNDTSLTAVLTGTVTGGTTPYSAVTWANSTIGTSGVCDSGFSCSVSLGRGTNAVSLSVSDSANGSATANVSVTGPPYR